MYVKEGFQLNTYNIYVAIRTVNLPKLGFCLPAKILRAVDLPIPLVPTKPNTSPGRGIGSLCSLNEFLE